MDWPSTRQWPGQGTDCNPCDRPKAFGQRERLAIKLVYADHSYTLKLANLLKSAPESTPEPASHSLPTVSTILVSRPLLLALVTLSP